MKRILYFQSHTTLPTSFGEACLSLTPKIFAPRVDTLFLDIGVTQKLLGGEGRMLRQFENLTLSFEIEGKLVLTDRPEWAWALATQSSVIIPPGESENNLLKLDIDQIAYCGDPSTVEEEFPERTRLITFMKRVGLTTIDDFARLNHQAIGRRFGKLGILLLEYVKGQRELCLPPFLPSESIQETIDTEEVTSWEVLLFHLKPALTRIEARLCGRALLARAFLLTFHLDGGNKISKTLALAEPIREANSLLRLLKEYLGDMRWDSPLATLDIEVSDTLPFVAGQLSLFDQTENKFSDLAQYVERLRTRFGKDAVGFAELRESYCPERSWNLVRPPPTPCPAPPIHIGLRPLFLYTPPRPYTPPKNWNPIPSENLATEWWEKGGFRRYFIAQTPQGERLWVFWDSQRHEWFLHGTFD